MINQIQYLSFNLIIFSIPFEFILQIHHQMNKMILIQQHQQLNINKENDNNTLLDIEDKQPFNDILGVTELCCFVKENYTGFEKSSNVNADYKMLANTNKNNLNKIRYFEIKK